MTCLPADTQFRLLKKAMPECLVMAKVWGFNVKTAEEELSLVFADRDHQQFKVYNTYISEEMCRNVLIFKYHS